MDNCQSSDNDLDNFVCVLLGLFVDNNLLVWATLLFVDNNLLFVVNDLLFVVDNLLFVVNDSLFVDGDV